MDLIGRTLDGKYRIVGEIGQGGMASVFKAYQPALDRYVAIKVLPAQHALAPGFSERFVREARAVAQLNHPNILSVIDFGQDEGLSYIVMKYVAGGTLKDRLGQPMKLAETVRIVGQIAAALDHAHGRGVLHRDVKPSNVLLDEGDWVQLADFGLAKMLVGDEGLTATGVGIGTPSYMSPEQGQGLPVDQRADIYSLGVVLYEMVTGRLPYSAETPMAIVIKHIYEPLPLPRQLNPALPEAVERVILKAMAKASTDRYASAGELARALEQAVGGLSPTSEASTAKVVTEEKSGLTSQAGGMSQVPGVEKKQPWLLMAGGAVAVLLAIAGLLVIGAIAFFAIRNRGTSTSPAETSQAAAAFETATLTPATTPTPESSLPPAADAKADIEGGWASLKQGDTEPAIAHFSRAIILDPQSSEAYAGRGDAYSQMGDFKHALPDYDKAIELNPLYAHAYAGRGWAYYGLDDEKRAMADYNKAIQLDPNNAEAYYFRGHAYYSSHDYEPAMADYNQAIALKFDPLGWAYNARGRVYYAQGNYDQAIADHTKAIELGPDGDHFTYYEDRGDVYYSQGDYEQAIADYTQAIGLNADAPYSYYSRGAAYQELGDKEKAIADLRRALELASADASWREDAQERLQQLGE
jgi:tetratricopeptide (TPR) repeat protein